MQAHFNHSHTYQQAVGIQSNGADLSAQSPAPALGNLGLVDSTQLLKGRKAVEISHNGSIYRLQSTKLGKLILTK